MGRGTRPGVDPRPADVRPVHPVVEPGRRTPGPRRGGAPRHRVRSLALGGRARVARRFPPREPPPCGGGSSRQSSGRADDGQPPTGLGPGRILCADRLEHSPTPRLDRVRTPRDGAGDRHRDEGFSGTLDGGVLRPDLGRSHDGSRPRRPPGGRPELARALRDLDRVRPAPVAGRFAGTASLLLGLDLVVAMPISWWPLISDYNRFARSPGEAAAGTSLGYVVANTSFYLIGAALVLLGITSFGLDPQDPYAFLATLGLLGLSALPLLAILVDETDNAFADVYSAAVSVQNLSVRRRQATTIVGSTLIGIAAAWYLVGSGQGIGGPYETFLLLIGGLFVPLLGVVIAETFVVRRSRYSPSDFFQAAPRWRWPAFAAPLGRSRLA